MTNQAARESSRPVYFRVKWKTCGNWSKVTNTDTCRCEHSHLTPNESEGSLHQHRHGIARSEQQAGGDLAFASIPLNRRLESERGPLASSFTLM